MPDTSAPTADGVPVAPLAGTRLAEFYRDRQVLVTGHTGLLGTWVVALLAGCRARPVGLARGTRTPLPGGIHATFADIREFDSVIDAISASGASVALHLAAQPQARMRQRKLTYETNVLGTLNVLESAAVLGIPGCVIVSSSRDSAQVSPGDHEFWDPYNASKLAAEQLGLAYRSDALRADPPRGVAIARPAVLIGGGDQAAGRLVPDVMAALRRGEPLRLRTAGQYRPWQHAIEAASGILWLAAILAREPAMLAPAYNFGLSSQPATPVSAGTMASRLNALWSRTRQFPGQGEDRSSGGYWLDCRQAQMDLGWAPCWTLDTALMATVDWHRANAQGSAAAHAVMVEQVGCYARDAAAAGLAWAQPAG